MADRYESVRVALPDVFPSITRDEAQKAGDRIWKKFAPDGSKHFNVRVRRCWIARKPTTGHRRGWGRLIHDLSHDVFRRVYRGQRRPHDPLHARYETDIATWVVESGFLTGKLKPKPKVKRVRTPVDERVKVEAAIKRWTTKARRADTALRKLKRKMRRLAKG